MMEKLLFTELRTLTIDDLLEGQKELGLDLESALIENENIKSIGYTLKGEDVMKLAANYAANPNMTSLYDRIKEFEPDIETDPMYPNFPIQVLEMSTLEFRIHQLVHYLTTYGFKDIYGVEVAKGWLPKTEDRMERLDDEQVVDFKVLDLLRTSEVNEYVIDKVIGKKERLLPNELEIAKTVILDKNRKPIESIPFKENIGAIYGDILLGEYSFKDYNPREYALMDLTNVLKHPGDVMDLIEKLVKLNKYKHFKTSLKRGLVDLLESYSVSALEENLASDRWSNTFLGKRGKRRAINKNVALIDYLSYNKFSKRSSHKAIVDKLKDGELLSWNQRLEKAYRSEKLDVVAEMLKERPGVYFRQVNRLVKAGWSQSKIAKDMSALGKNLKTQSIISALNNFDGEADVYKVFYEALISNLQSKEVESIAGKKVFLSENDVDFAKSRIEITDKLEEGGYINNGLALKLPDDVKYLRFFTYWDDERTVDIDLHAAYVVSEKDHINHIGWNGSRGGDGLVYSGDITHSDAAEYIDIDLEKAKASGVETVQFNINSYTGIPFKHIDTIFTGIMALGKMGEKVKLYDQKNVMFRHNLMNSTMATDYGQLNLKDGLLQIIGSNSNSHNDNNVREIDLKLTIISYLYLLFATQGTVVVDNEKDADVVIGLAKTDKDNYLSLIDENFFMGE